LKLPLVLLGLAIAAAWLPIPRWRGIPLPAWVALFVAAILAGAASGMLAPAAVTALALAGALAAAARLAPRGRGWFMLLLAAWTLALALHVLPGFHNPLLVDGVRLGADARPFTARLNFDKGAAGLLLLAALGRPEGAMAPRRAFAWTAAGALATAAAALGLATLLGITRPEAKWPGFAPVFLAGNLLFTCVAEEAFFRGLVQQRLARLGGRPAGVAAVLVASALFGLAHAAGGAATTGVAAVAGIGYGTVYAATRRLECAIAAHFALNAAHFTLFVYPGIWPPA